MHGATIKIIINLRFLWVPHASTRWLSVSSWTSDGNTETQNGTDIYCRCMLMFTDLLLLSNHRISTI